MVTTALRRPWWYNGLSFWQPTVPSECHWEWNVIWYTKTFLPVISQNQYLLIITDITRYSENDNTPQPLNQWTNSPFMGNRLETKEFYTDPLLGLSICHAPWPKVNPIAHPTSYPTHIPFITSESTLPFLRYSNFNILPWKSKVKVMGEVKVESHNMGPTFLSTHIPFIPCQSAIPFRRYDFFKIWPWKSKVKIMVEVKVESHKVGVTSYRSHPFCFMSINPSFPVIQNFLNLTLKIQGEGEMTMMLHNYRSRQFYINPSNSFRDMATKSGPSVASFDKFWAKGKPIWGKWANYYDSAQPQV